jgi:hypothetical protein
MLINASAPPFIAGAGGAAYMRVMLALLTRLIAMLALALMPLSMGASAAAATVSSAKTAHCGGQTQDEPTVPAETKMHCLSCAGLPALAASFAPRAVAAVSPQRSAPVAVFSGIDIEIATPPPKQA